MKNLWKVVATLVVVAGAVMILVRCWDKIDERLRNAGKRCRCKTEVDHFCCQAAEELKDEACEVAHGAAEAVRDGAEKVADKAQELAENVTPEDFAD